MSEQLYLGLTGEQAKHMARLINLLIGLGGRYDMLTASEQNDLKYYLVKMQMAQDSSPTKIE